MSSKAKNEDLGDQNNDLHKIVWRLKVFEGGDCYQS